MRKLLDTLKETIQNLFTRDNSNFDFDVPDEYSQMLLIRQIYLHKLSELVLKRASVERSKLYYEIKVEESEVSKAVLEKYPGVKDNIGQNFSYLVVDDYLILESPDEKKTMYVSFTKKGWVAATDGEFKKKHDERQTALRSLELTKKSIAAHSHQRFINWVLTIAAVLSAIMPFVVAKYFPTTVDIPEQKFRHDIRIDSVWLSNEMEKFQQKKISTEISR